MTNFFRKGIIALELSAVLILLSGCGAAKAEAGFEKLREAVLASERVTAKTELTSRQGDTVRKYTLAAEASGGETVVEVVEPDIIAGVRARVSNGGAEVEYDGVLLGAAETAVAGLSPISALPKLISAIVDAHVESVWLEDGRIAAHLIPSDEVELTLWLDEADFTPVAAEFTDTKDGAMVISCAITGFTT